MQLPGPASPCTLPSHEPCFDAPPRTQHAVGTQGPGQPAGPCPCLPSSVLSQLYPLQFTSTCEGAPGSQMPCSAQHLHACGMFGRSAGAGCLRQLSGKHMPTCSPKSRCLWWHRLESQEWRPVTCLLAAGGRVRGCDWYRDARAAEHKDKSLLQLS